MSKSSTLPSTKRMSWRPTWRSTGSASWTPISLAAPSCAPGTPSAASPSPPPPRAGTVWIGSSFVAKTSATRLQSFCDPEEFEDTDLVYESAAQVSALDHGRHPVSPNSLAGEVCTVPGLNSERPLFVGQVYFCSMGHSWDCILHWIDAESLGRKKDGSFKRPTKAIMAAMRQARKDNVSATRFLAADKDRLEDAEVLAW
jgi:hypothetical protein